MRRISVPENDFIGQIQQGFQAIRRELPREQVRLREIRLPQPINQLRRHFHGSVRVRVPVNRARPINPGKSVTGYPFRIRH